MHHSQRGITLLEYLIIIVVTVVGCILVGHAIYDNRHGGHRKTACAANLRSLWQCQVIYTGLYGGPEKRFPSETGHDFWLRLATTPKPIVDNLRIFVCPLSGEEERPGYCGYRGPRFDVNAFRDDDPVGADRADNHGEGEGGNVLLKTGSIETRKADDRIWIDCATRLAP